MLEVSDVSPVEGEQYLVGMEKPFGNTYLQKPIHEKFFPLIVRTLAPMCGIMSSATHITESSSKTPAAPKEQQKSAESSVCGGSKTKFPDTKRTVTIYQRPNTDVPSFTLVEYLRQPASDDSWTPLRISSKEPKAQNSRDAA